MFRFPEFNPRRRDLGAFTLLEVMLAVFVFSLVMTSLFMLLNSSSRTFERTTARVDKLYRARGAMDVVTRDLRSIYFMDESSYNITARQVTEQLTAEANAIQGEIDRGDEVEDRRNSSRFARRRGDNDKDEDDAFLLPPEIDLTFIGKNSGHTDELSFVTHQPNRPDGYPSPWGLRRVHYYVKDDILYRTEEDVFKEHVDQNGVTIEKEAPKPEKIADGVLDFNATYFYWIDGVWTEVDSWNSGENTYRFPETIDAFIEWGLTHQQGRELIDSLPSDNLPSLMRLEVSFQHSRQKGRVIPYRKTFRFFGAQETSFPVENLLPNADDREASDRKRASNERRNDRNSRGMDRERGRNR